MIPIAGIPLLARTLNWLGSQGVDEAAVNQGVGAVDVALLDAGALTLRGVALDEANPDPARSPTATQAVLAPQRYPELSPFVSGVVYGLDTYSSYGYPEGGNAAVLSGVIVQPPQ